MIRLEKVSKYYNKNKKNQVNAIDNTSLTMGKNGLVCLLGASGCGKTTLLNVIGGLEKTNKGNIYIDGKRITHKRVYKVDKIRNLSIGYIFQDYKLIDNLSVFDNVALVLKMIGIKDKKEIKKRVDFILNVLNIYRYRNRPAAALSGGERQRVAIARALVKDPDILLADEPTGNLDSKNTLEIMNIIKSISKTKLVVLVTHEVNLAKFYATRIIEIEDGKVIKDYENKTDAKLNYAIESNIYLKDLKHHVKLDKSDNLINYYNDNNEKINITMVIKNGNIFIKNNGFEKVTLVDNESNVEFIDEHYKELEKEEVNKYIFDSKELKSNKVKKYSSILNPITLLINGFKKIKSYTFVKKLLLLGYVAASMFVLFSISRIFGAKLINDADFIHDNITHIKAEIPKLDKDKYDNVSKLEDINYIYPIGDNNPGFKIKYNTYFQVGEVYDVLQGSISGIDLINNSDIIYGRMPYNKYEIVVDRMILDKLYDISFENGMAYAKMAGLKSIEEFINMDVYQNNNYTYKIVGITDLKSPSIYINTESIYNVIYNSFSYYEEANIYKDYKDEELKIKKGRYPSNDYEALINYNLKDFYGIGKKLDNRINNTSLKVVGYYESEEDSNTIYVNNKMIELELIGNSSNIIISSNHKEQTLAELTEMKIKASDLYESNKQSYIDDNAESVKSTVIFASIIIAISLIEILLMVRSSFLSRIKEVGIYRAIGVKKSDIYKMFLGEILAISLTASLIGNIFMSYILVNISKMKYIGDSFIINPQIALLSYIICLLFNVIVGLIPVANTMRKRPAQILARHDI